MSDFEFHENEEDHRIIAAAKAAYEFYMNAEENGLFNSFESLHINSRFLWYELVREAIGAYLIENNRS